MTHYPTSSLVHVWVDQTVLSAALGCLEMRPRVSEQRNVRKNLSHKHLEPIRRWNCDTSERRRVSRSCSTAATASTSSHLLTGNHTEGRKPSRLLHSASFLLLSTEDSRTPRPPHNEGGNTRGQSLFSVFYLKNKVLGSC